MKTNENTVNAVNIIAKILGRKPRTISYAGTKDKRAITTQKMSIFAL